MKNIFLLLFFIATQNYSQSIEAIYTSAAIKAFGSVSEDISEAIKPKTFAYTYANEKSTYKLIPSQKSAIDTSYIEQGGLKFVTYKEIRLPTTDITFKDLKSKVLQMEYTIAKKDFSAKEQLIDYEWIIEDETIVINGFTCKKATTTKNLFPVTAWYCEEIPINDGPSVYWGLPGLILKVELGGYTTITLDKIKISKENLEIEEPKINDTQFSVRGLYKNVKGYLDSISPTTKYK